MTRTPRLNDLQLILLSTAARRDNGTLLPPPPSVAGSPDRIRRELTTLLRRELVAEFVTPDRAAMWREAEDALLGLTITEAGRAAIGVKDTPSAEAAGSPVPARPARIGTKSGRVLDLLRRPEGATLADLIAATGWLPHTTRAALTGLRRKGHSIARSSRDGVTCYQIGEAA